MNMMIHYSRIKCSKLSWLKRFRYILLDTQPKLNLLQTFTWRSGGHMNTLCVFSLGRVFTWISFVILKNSILQEGIFSEITVFVH